VDGGGGENKQREKERERAKGEKEREGSEAGKGVARPPGTLDNHRTTWRRGASRKSVGQLDLQGRKKKVELAPKHTGPWRRDHGIGGLWNLGN
jgi:hypothetical protein